MGAKIWMRNMELTVRTEQIVRCQRAWPTKISVVGCGGAGNNIVKIFGQLQKKCRRSR